MRENPAAKIILVVFAVFMLFSLVIYANDVIFKFDFIPSADDIISWLNGKSNAVTVADGGSSSGGTGGLPDDGEEENPLG